MKRALCCIGLCLIFLFAFSQNTEHHLTIATFNIQNFGKTKLSKTNVVDTLATVVRMFDIVAVQEVSDVSNHTAFSFLDIINQHSRYHYKLACSDRTGRQADDKHSQEQYAFYYNADVVSLLDTSLFDDSEKDDFQREPYIASFQTLKGRLSFILCTVHTTPEYAVQEIGSLAEVAAWIPRRFKNVHNIIFCGDFNASCAYASPEQLRQLPIHNKPYHWIIPDTAKTNLTRNKRCAYDRFVVTDSLFPQVTGWSVLHYFSTKQVSDHWPVYIELKY